MIFIARTAGITETSGTSFSPFLSLGTFFLFPSISSLQKIPSFLHWVDSLKLSLIGKYFALLQSNNRELLLSSWYWLTSQIS